MQKLKPLTFLAVPALLAIALGCAETPEQTVTAKDPIIIPSTQSQHRFFACKDLIDGEWVGIGDSFTTDDPKIVIVARLDQKEIGSWLAMEILSPENKIVEKEDRQYLAAQDVGIFFDPIALVDKSGPGRYKAHIYSDSRPMGQVIFFLQDTREEAEKAEKEASPALSGVEWKSPDEAKPEPEAAAE